MAHAGSNWGSPKGKEDNDQKDNHKESPCCQEDWSQENCNQKDSRPKESKDTKEDRRQEDCTQESRNKKDTHKSKESHQV